MTNSVDSDQLASSEANWSGSTLFAKAGHIQVQNELGLKALCNEAQYSHELNSTSSNIRTMQGPHDPKSGVLTTLPAWHFRQTDMGKTICSFSFSKDGCQERLPEIIMNQQLAGGQKWPPVINWIPVIIWWPKDYR